MWPCVIFFISLLDQQVQNKKQYTINDAKEKSFMHKISRILGKSDSCLATRTVNLFTNRMPELCGKKLTLLKCGDI